MQFAIWGFMSWKAMWHENAMTYDAAGVRLLEVSIHLRRWTINLAQTHVGVKKCKSACWWERGPHTQGLVKRALWVLFFFAFQSSQFYGLTKCSDTTIDIWEDAGWSGGDCRNFQGSAWWDSPVLCLCEFEAIQSQWRGSSFVTLNGQSSSRMLTLFPLGWWASHWIRIHPMARVCGHRDWWGNPSPVSGYLVLLAMRWLPMGYLLFIVLFGWDDGFPMEWWPHHALQGQGLRYWRGFISCGSKLHQEMLGECWEWLGSMLGLAWV